MKAVCGSYLIQELLLQILKFTEREEPEKPTGYRLALGPVWKLDNWNIIKERLSYRS